ncbi:MAG: hypothetical protein LC742_02515, partial [Acidobacteria bacterium]|nr:hypothetical protein [Acidobacteriota bacterium]
FSRAAEPSVAVVETDEDSVCSGERVLANRPPSPKATVLSKQSKAKKKKNTDVDTTEQVSFLWG